MKTFAIICVVLSSVLVAAWPVAFFLSAFLFDAPVHGRADTARWIFAYGIWTYPWGFLAGLGYLIARRIALKDRPWWKPPTAYLFLLPFVHLAVLLLVVFGVELL
jgi:hypothetical protein